MKKDPGLSLGVDLGSHAAKAVLLDITGETPVLKGHKKFSVSKEGRPLSRPQAVSLLRDEIRDWADMAAWVTVGVSGKDVIVRYLEMPRLSLAELRKSLNFEADRYLPFKLTDAQFDTQILLEATAVPNKMWVILVAAKKVLVDDRLLLFQEAGIAATKVEVTATGLINSYLAFAPQDAQKAGTLLIDVGASSSLTGIVSSGVPYLSRELEFGGEMLTQALLKEGAPDYAKAEAAKIEGKVPFEGTPSRLIRPLLKELKSSFDYFEGITEKAVEKIVLTGGMAPLAGLAPFLADQMKKPAEIFAPAKQLKKDLPAGQPEAFDKGSHEYAVALGYAAKGKTGD